MKPIWTTLNAYNSDYNVALFILTMRKKAKKIYEQIEYWWCLCVLFDGGSYNTFFREGDGQCLVSSAPLFRRQSPWTQPKRRSRWASRGGSAPTHLRMGRPFMEKSEGENKKIAFLRKNRKIISKKNPKGTTRKYFKPLRIEWIHETASIAYALRVVCSRRNPSASNCRHSAYQWLSKYPHKIL